jgi:glycosyltransferase involved in cell wall biosynthesis
MFQWGQQGTIAEIADTFFPAIGRGVSVVIPAFNEGPHIADQLRAVDEVMRQSEWDYEIIVVDDGSSDDTAVNAASTGVHVLRRAHNQGYGAALKAGIRVASFDWILIIDADGTYPAESIPKLLARSDDNDMVVGARVGEDVNIPWVRRPAKWFLKKLGSYLVERDLIDINSGLRLMRKGLVKHYEHLLPQGFSFTTTITLSCACNGHIMEYVPISYKSRLGDSKIRPHHAFDFLLLIVRTIVFFNPLKVFLPLGALLFLAGSAKFVYDLALSDLSESAVLAFLGALIIWSVGLLADQRSCNGQRP